MLAFKVYQTDSESELLKMLQINDRQTISMCTQWIPKNGSMICLLDIAEYLVNFWITRQSANLKLGNLNLRFQLRFPLPSQCDLLGAISVTTTLNNAQQSVCLIQIFDPDFRSRFSIQIVDVLNLFNRIGLSSVKFFNKLFFKNSFGWSGELSTSLNRTFSKFLIFRPRSRLWNSTFAVQTWKHKKAHRLSLSRSKLRPFTTACDSFLLKSELIVF